MRLIACLLLLPMVVSCNRGGDEPLRRADGSLLSDAGGEVTLTDGSRLEFLITSERYKQWDAARTGLSGSVVARFGALLKPKSPTQQSIARATAFLESIPQARQSIERTGMSVRDFVLMTVALEQEMQLASSRGEPAAQAPMDPYPVDTAYTLPNVPPAQIPMAPMPVPAPGTTYAPMPGSTYVPSPAPGTPATVLPPPRYDTIARRDTIGPTPTPVPPRPDSTYRRDSLARPVQPPKPRSDSVPPPAPPPRADSSSAAIAPPALPHPRRRA